MIPGSLKGKMRTLMSRQYSENYMPVEVKNDPEIVQRLFGSADKKRIQKCEITIFGQSFLSNIDEVKSRGVSRPTEVKFENTIKRLTSEANPRQIERVIPGCKFNISIIYNINSDAQLNEMQIEEDFKAIKNGLKLLEYDYIGGHGTRGYGKIKFNNVEVNNVFGDVADDVMDKCKGFWRNSI